MPRFGPHGLNGEMIQPNKWDKQETILNHELALSIKANTLLKHYHSDSILKLP